MSAVADLSPPSIIRGLTITVDRITECYNRKIPSASVSTKGREKTGTEGFRDDVCVSGLTRFLFSLFNGEKKEATFPYLAVHKVLSLPLVVGL